MFQLIKKIFLELLTGLNNGSNHTKFVFLINQKCMTELSLINLNLNEHIHELHYYAFVVKLDGCVGSCNSLNVLSNEVCVQEKTKEINLSMFNMIT